MGRLSHCPISASVSQSNLENFFFLPVAGNSRSGICSPGIIIGSGPSGLLFGVGGRLPGLVGVLF